MMRLTFPGATYTSAQPDGSVARVYADRVETTEQRVEFPGEGVLALVSRRYNDFLYLSGQGQGSGQAWLWGPTGWHPMGYSHGVSPCAFGTDSLFFSASPESYTRVRLDTGEVTTHARQIGSQGIRYVEGETVVTGDQTIYDGTVHEFTDRGDVRGGQSSIDGYLLNGKDLGWTDDRGTFHREGGNVQFCRLERDGDSLAVSLVKFLEGESVVYLLTRVEVDALPPPPVPPPDPVLQPPKVTVLEWDSLMKAGVPWHARFTTGAIDTVEVRKDEQDRLTVLAVNVAGSDQTGSVRQLTVEGPDHEPEPEPEPPPMHTASRFWCHPNIGSKDLLDVFDDLSRLANVDVFGLYVQEILTDVSNPQLGTNIWPNLVAHDVVRKLAQAGIPLAIELGAVKPGDCLAQGNISGMQTALQRVHDAGGVVGYLTMDEPLTANQQACGGNLVQCADAVAAFIHSAAAIDPDIKVGWIEAWPEVSYANQASFLTELGSRHALPTHWHLDIDWNRSGNDTKTSAFIHQCQALADSYGIILGVQINATKDPLATEVAHHQNLLALAQKLNGILPAAAHVVTQSWCTRTGGTQDMPNNLGAAGLLETFAAVMPLFAAVTPPEPPQGEPVKQTTISDKPPVAVKEAKPVNGEPGVFTLILPDDTVYSMQPGGVDGTRPAGTAGQYEKCTIDGSLATFFPDGAYLSRWFVTVAGL